MRLYLAEQGKKVILRKDYNTLNKLIDKKFDLRCKIMKISESNMELIKTARNCGASAKFSGSGGAIIGTYENEKMYHKLQRALNEIGVEVIKPQILNNK